MFALASKLSVESDLHYPSVMFSWRFPTSAGLRGSPRSLPIRCPEGRGLRTGLTGPFVRMRPDSSGERRAGALRNELCKEQSWGIWIGVFPMWCAFSLTM